MTAGEVFLETNLIMSSARNMSSKEHKQRSFCFRTCFFLLLNTKKPIHAKSSESHSSNTSTYRKHSRTAFNSALYRVAKQIQQ